MRNINNIVDVPKIAGMCHEGLIRFLKRLKI